MFETNTPYGYTDAIEGVKTQGASKPATIGGFATMAFAFVGVVSTTRVLLRLVRK